MKCDEKQTDDDSCWRSCIGHIGTMFSMGTDKLLLTIENCSVSVRND